jgi:hypothetical protein
MQAQFSIFDKHLSRQERDKSVLQAGNNANSEWKNLAYIAVESVARKKQRFTSDDVVKILEELEKMNEVYTHEKRALGGVMAKARKDKIMKPTDEFRASERKQSHANPKRVWESLIYNPLSF